MTLKEANTRYAALKLIRDVIDEEMKREKAEHLQALEANAAETGSKSWSVEVSGVEVATVSLAQRAESISLTDPAALAAYVQDTHPDMVELSLKPWAAAALGKAAKTVVDGVAFDIDGTEIGPGFAVKPAGDAYQSVRWNSKTAGKQMMGDAIQSGELRSLLSGVPLLEQA